MNSNNLDTSCARPFTQVQESLQRNLLPIISLYTEMLEYVQMSILIRENEAQFVRRMLLFEDEKV